MPQSDFCKRPAFLIILTTILTLLASACGNSGGQPASSTAPSGTTPAAGSATTPTSGGNGVTLTVASSRVTIKPGGGQAFEPRAPLTITIWEPQRGGNQAALVKLADTFHAKHPNITIKWENNNGAYTYGSILKALQAAASAGGLPNMASGYENWVPGFVDSKTILGFNQFISGPYGLTQAQLEDINPVFLSRGIFPQYNNEMYLFPFANSTPVLYFNLDILTKYHLQAPQTWDDLVKESQQISKQSNGETAGLVFNPKTVSEFVAGMYSQGCKVYDYSSKTFFFTDPACVKHLQLYYDGVKGHYFLASDPDQQFADQQAFELQKATFYISSTSSRSYIDSDLKKGVNGAKVFNWNAAVIPHATDHAPVSTLYGGGILAFKGKSADEDLAIWEVAKYLASPEFTAPWATKSGYAPVDKSALDNPDYKAFLAKNPHNGIPIEATKYATLSEPKVGFWQNIRDTFDSEVAALFQDQSGQITVQSTMQKIQTKAQSLA